MQNKRFFRFALQAVVIIVAIAAWELFTRINTSTLIPAPSSVWAALQELFARGILIEDFTESIHRVVAGFAFAVLTGVSLGFALGASSRLHMAFSPLIELLRPVPPIAWIPLAMTIFGLGDGSACFVIFIGAFYPVLTNTILGVREVPEIFIDAAKSLGCSTSQRFTKVIWPGSLPSVFAGLKVGLGFAWMCVVAAEMVAARSGLGYEIQLNRQLLRLDRVVAGMVVIGVVGFVMNWCLAKVEKLCLPWRTNSAGANLDADNEQFQPSNPEEVAGQEATIVGCSIELKDLRFAHSDGRAVLENLNLEVPRGEILCVLGPSGCGKTTLLRLIAGLLTPSSGTIDVDGEDLKTHRNDITMVFQNSALFPWRTAEGNVRFALESRSSSQDDMSSMSKKFLRLVGLEARAKHYPNQLSGGQQQRVALARALAYAPKILLMDEPFASLDSQTREKLQEELSTLLAKTRITAVFVTHDIREAIFLADRVVVCSKQGGRLFSPHKIQTSQPRQDSFRYSKEFSESRLFLWNLLKEASDEELCSV